MALPLSTNICGSDPHFWQENAGLWLPSVPLFPPLFPISILSLSDVCFSPQSHLLSIFSEILTLIEAGWDGKRRAEIEIRASALFSSPSFSVLNKASTFVEHVFHIACLNFHLWFVIAGMQVLSFTPASQKQGQRGQNTSGMDLWPNGF